MFDLSTFGPAVVSIGGFAALIVFIKALAGGDEHPLDDSLPRGRQEEEPIRFRFPKLLAPAPSGARGRAPPPPPTPPRPRALGRGGLKPRLSSLVLPRPGTVPSSRVVCRARRSTLRF